LGSTLRHAHMKAACSEANTISTPGMYISRYFPLSARERSRFVNFSAVVCLLLYECVDAWIVRWIDIWIDISGKGAEGPYYNRQYTRITIMDYFKLSDQSASVPGSLGIMFWNSSTQGDQCPSLDPHPGSCARTTSWLAFSLYNEFHRLIANAAQIADVFSSTGLKTAGLSPEHMIS
jgi:hypothetical protein